MVEEGKDWLKGATTPVVQFNKVIKHIQELVQDVCDKKISAANLQMYVGGLLDGSTFCRTPFDVVPLTANKKKKKKRKKKK